MPVMICLVCCNVVFFHCHCMSPWTRGKARRCAGFLYHCLVLVMACLVCYNFFSFFVVVVVVAVTVKRLEPEARCYRMSKVNQ